MTSLCSSCHLLWSTLWVLVKPSVSFKTVLLLYHKRSELFYTWPYLSRNTDIFTLYLGAAQDFCCWFPLWGLEPWWLLSLNSFPTGSALHSNVISCKLFTGKTLPTAAMQLCLMLNMESTDILTQGEDLCSGKSFYHMIKLSFKWYKK